jgi:hypothetical protein
MRRDLQCLWNVARIAEIKRQIARCREEQARCLVELERANANGASEKEIFGITLGLNDWATEEMLFLEPELRKLETDDEANR